MHCPADQLESTIKDMFLEPDAYEFIMCYFASTLTDGSGALLNLYGKGFNGISFLTKLHTQSIGVPTCRRIRWEQLPDTVEDARFVDIIGEYDGSSIDMSRIYNGNTRFCMSTTEKLIVWRTRAPTCIYSYAFKIRFLERPDPENPLEKKDNPYLLGYYINDPSWQKAWLQLLSKWSDIYNDKYSGNLNNIDCPSIQKITSLC